VQITTVKPPKESVEANLFAPERLAISDALRKAEESLYLIKNAEKYNVLGKISQRVGGLGNELGDIIRRVLASRQLTPKIMRSLGLSHVKGVLLHGPPGTGKTLIAREMARALNSREPVLINGPEIMDKYIGEAERKIREVFEAAEEEWEVRGRDSELHVIIFDEFDAIAKRRGSLGGDGSGVRDSCVNQLLTKLDGVDEMNNILVIALTNRKDLIDPALLRPGRLEVHMEIRPPDLYGREEILYLLFKPLVKGGFVSAADAKAWSSSIAKRTFGWTGAELSGLMRSAASFAIERSLSNRASSTYIAVTWGDIEKALKETSSTIKISKRAVFKNMLRTGVERYRQLKSGAEAKPKRREFEEIMAAPDVEGAWPGRGDAADTVQSSGDSDNSSSSGNDSSSTVDSVNEGEPSPPKPPGYTNIGGTLFF
jgi:SpoVK/Ycf46/Vps4 family AAA+-type ATPase